MRISTLLLRAAGTLLPRGAVVLALAAGGCSLLSAPTQTDITGFLTGLANKTTADLAVALATAETPVPNMPGGILSQVSVQCLQGDNSPTSIGGLIGAQKTANAVIANSTAAGAGAITAVVVAQAILPGGPLSQQLATGIANDCGPLIAQTNQAITVGSAAFFSAIASQFAITLAPTAL